MRVCFSLVGVGLLSMASLHAGFFDSNDNNNNGPINPSRNQSVYYYYNDQQQGTVQIAPNRQMPNPNMGNPSMQNPNFQGPAMQDQGIEDQGMMPPQGMTDQGMQDQGYPVDNRMSNVTSQNRSDADILRSVNGALAGGMLSKSYKQVHAQINNGVVTLTGFIENEQEREDILDRVKKVGVQHIDERLTIHNPEEDKKVEAGQIDRDLQRSVNDAIKSNVFTKNFKNVNAQVFNGDVTLTGFVDTEEAHKDLLERVKKIDGVQNVNDRLVIRPSAGNYSRRTNNLIAQAAPAPVTESDRTLNSKVRAALQGGFFSKGYENILSDVRGGVVTLRGTVSSESDRTTVIDRVQKLDGVEKIDNQIQIAK